MPKPETDYSRAVEELAESFARREFQDAVTWTDAKPYVDAGVIAAWIGTELHNYASPQSLLADIVAERLSDDDAKTLLCSIAIGYDTKVLALLQAALIEHVARDVAYAAQQILDDGPTDDEASRPIIRDDISDPFLAEQRSFTRRHNASLRVAL